MFFSGSMNNPHVYTSLLYQVGLIKVFMIFRLSEEILKPREIATDVKVESSESLYTVLNYVNY